MWRRKQEERGVFFCPDFNRDKKTHLSPKAPFPLASKNGFHISKKLIARIAARRNGIFEKMVKLGRMAGGSNRDFVNDNLLTI